LSLGDLTIGATRLRKATQSLSVAWNDAHERWSDERARQFQEQYLDPLEVCVRGALLSIGRLSEVVAKARRELDDGSP